MAHVIPIHKKVKFCSGCRQDFYNGHNDLGVKQCWSLEEAEFVVRKEVHVDQRPPWNQRPMRMLNCFHRPRHVYVDKERKQ